MECTTLLFQSSGYLPARLRTCLLADLYARVAWHLSSRFGYMALAFLTRQTAVLLHVAFTFF